MDLTQNELDQLRAAMNAELDRLIAARKPDVNQRPKTCDFYVYITGAGHIDNRIWLDTSVDADLMAVGNFYRPENRLQAERRVEALKVQAELRRMPGVVAHQRNKNIWFIGYSFGDLCVMYDHTNPMSAFCGVYFLDEHSAQSAFDKIGAKRLQLWLDDYLQTPIGGE